MTENNGYEGISDYLIPLYAAKTAHESFHLGLEMLMEAGPEQQLELLRNPVYVSAVQSAINGLDEGQKAHLEELVDALDNNNQREFYKVF